jgi:Iap family predicted aminopeptidase
VLLAAPGCSGGREAVRTPGISVVATGPPAVVATLPPAPVTPPPLPVEAPDEISPPIADDVFDLQRVLSDSQAIEDFGVRPVGSAAERKATEMVAQRLRQMGCTVRVETFPVPGGTSRNLIVRVPGKDPRTIVVGAHIDSKKTTPGANDDAAGVALLMEYARLLKARPAYATVELVVFGSEEYNDGKPSDHHWGSRYRVKKMTSADIHRTAGMISVDVVGYGANLHARTMGVGPSNMSDLLLAEARRLGVRLTYLKDPGKTGWSDHEPYEKAGIPAVWLERLQDPAYHKMSDTTDHLQQDRLRESGQLVLDVVRRLDAAKLDALQRR